MCHRSILQVNSHSVDEQCYRGETRDGERGIDWSGELASNRIRTRRTQRNSSTYQPYGRPQPVQHRANERFLPLFGLQENVLQYQHGYQEPLLCNIRELGWRRGKARTARKPSRGRVEDISWSVDLHIRTPLSMKGSKRIKNARTRAKPRRRNLDSLDSSRRMGFISTTATASLYAASVHV